MSILKRSYLLDAIYIAFSLLFLYSAFSKLLEYDLFRSQIGKSPLIIEHASWISVLIPALEVCIAIAFFVNRLKLIALFASFWLMFLFTLYIIFLLNFSPYVPCSCGGVLNGLGWEEHLVFNIAFTLLAIVGIRLYNSSVHTERSDNYTAANYQW